MLLGWPKKLEFFSIRFDKKIETNLLVNPIFHLMCPKFIHSTCSQDKSTNRIFGIIFSVQSSKSSVYSTLSARLISDQPQLQTPESHDAAGGFHMEQQLFFFF